MIIRANGKEILVKTIISDTLRRNGKGYPALRFEFENEATAEDIEALLCGSFEILDENGEVIGIHEGYNTLKGVSVVIGKITPDEQRIEELEASLAATEAANEELQSAIDVMVGGSADDNN